MAAPIQDLQFAVRYNEATSGMLASKLAALLERREAVAGAIAQAMPALRKAAAENFDLPLLDPR